MKQEPGHQLLPMQRDIDTHAVIWRREDCDHVLLVRPVVSLHDELMRSRNKREAVVVIEGFRDILSERISCTSW